MHLILPGSEDYLRFNAKSRLIYSLMISCVIHLARTKWKIWHKADRAAKPRCTRKFYVHQGLGNCLCYFIRAPQLAKYSRPSAQKGCASFAQRACSTFLCFPPANVPTDLFIWSLFTAAPTCSMVTSWRLQISLPWHKNAQFMSRRCTKWANSIVFWYLRDTKTCISCHGG